MAFITIPVLFIDPEDAEESKLVGKEPQGDTGEVVVNTNCICTYHSTDDGDVVLHMIDGSDIIVPLEIEDWEKLLNDIESVIKLNVIGAN